MTAPTPQLTKKWKLDVNTGTSGSPVWTNVRGLTAFQFSPSSTTASRTTFDSGLWSEGQWTTELSWSVTASVLKQLYSGVEDDGQKALREAALPSGEEQPGQVEVRFYDRFGGEEAKFGTVTVQWADQDASGLDSANITLSGVGAPTDISNPENDDQVPLIGSALPSAVAQGGLVTIVGSYFGDVTGAAGVKFGATNATSYVVASATKIVAVMPAGSAGAANVTVTNAAGTSVAKAYTRGA